MTTSADALKQSRAPEHHKFLSPLELKLLIGGVAVFTLLGLDAKLGHLFSTHARSRAKVTHPSTGGGLTVLDHQHGGLYGGGKGSIDPESLPPQYAKALANVQSSLKDR